MNRLYHRYDLTCIIVLFAGDNNGDSTNISRILIISILSPMVILNTRKAGDMNQRYSSPYNILNYVILIVQKVNHIGLSRDYVKT